MPVTTYNHGDFFTYAPQLVGKPPKNYKNILKSNNWLGSLKVDGYFEFICKLNGKPYMFARNVSKKTGLPTEKINHVPHIKQWIADNLPDNTILAAEIYLPYGTSKDVTTILGCLEDTAVARQEKIGKLQLWIHDIIMWDGYDFVANKISYEDRYKNLVQDVAAIATNIIQVAPMYDSAKCDLVELAEQWIAAGQEGMVIRAKNEPYYPAARKPNVMMKIKQELASDVDLVVTGLLDPTYYYEGKEADTWQYKDDNGNLITKAAFYGWKNALELSAYDSNSNLVKIGQVASGITDDMKEDMGKNPDKYIGSVAQVKAMSWTEDGALRHPIFICMRPDKNPADCTIDSLK